MALQATLKLEGKSYDVRDLEYEIEKSYTNNLKPSSIARGGIINFTILSPMDGNLVFHEWVLSKAEIKEGEFILPLTNGIKHVEKKLSFEKAHCVRLSENYSSFNESQLYMRLTITAAIIDFGKGVKFTNCEL